MWRAYEFWISDSRFGSAPPSVWPTDIELSLFEHRSRLQQQQQEAVDSDVFPRPGVRDGGRGGGSVPSSNR